MAGLLDPLREFLAAFGGGPKPKADAPADEFAEITAANKNLRETAKWILTSFAAIGAILVAGLELSSLGELTGETPNERVWAALLGILVAAVGVGLAIGFLGAVLTPFLNTFRSADEHPKVTASVLGDREIIGLTYGELKEKIAEKDRALAEARKPGAPADAAEEARANRVAWERIKNAALVHIGTELLRQRYNRALIAVFAGGFLVVVGLVAFAWGANPPEDETEAKPVILGQAPLLLDVSLTPAGVEALKEKRSCAARALQVLSISGQEGNREVVAIPSGACKTVRFVLTPRLGTSTAAAAG